MLAVVCGVSCLLEGRECAEQPGLSIRHLGAGEQRGCCPSCEPRVRTNFPCTSEGFCGLLQDSHPPFSSLCALL